MTTAIASAIVAMDALEMAFFNAAHVAITKQALANTGLDHANSAQRARASELHDAVWAEIRLDVDEALADRAPDWTEQSVALLAEATVERLLKGYAWPPN